MSADIEAVNAALRAVSESMARIRGEAAAGRLLAIQTLDVLLFQTSKPEVVIEKINQNIDMALNTFATEATDPDTIALNDIMREQARLKCYEFLDSLRDRHRARE